MTDVEIYQLWKRVRSWEIEYNGVLVYSSIGGIGTGLSEDTKRLLVNILGRCDFEAFLMSYRASVKNDKITMKWQTK